jgi:hypothetical protein
MIDFPEINLPQIDLSQTKEAFASVEEILLSVETKKSFLSLDEHKRLIRERKLSYDDLLDFAACYTADYELHEFENENLKKLLDAQERLLSAQQEIDKMRATNHEAILKLSELHELVTTTERYLTGQIQGRATQKKMHGVKAANARHSKPGGSRDKWQQMRALWASGKYSTRDICAEQESAALDMSFSSARKALRGTPDPT